MKKTTIVFICVVFLFSLVRCSSKYSADNCIGKTSAQIEAEYLFFITFDENGIAVACEEGYRPGG